MDIKDMKEKIIYCLLGFSIVLNIYTINLVLNFRDNMANSLSDLNIEVMRTQNDVNRVSNSLNGQGRKVDEYMTKEKMTKDVMSRYELAEYLNISIYKLWEILEDKESKIPYVLVDGEHRFSKDNIDKWLASVKHIDTYKNILPSK
ncbi:helix-turn-helix domain-containing protein [uncultured Clostridium sp.]|uniref:helix-turn-helix domain-containing protein n=1 Tax=uncultured Clostridium sp. TaxID=59620 RepID=UPI0028F0B5DC|nr:helix-turn-helix domain-containing protein [uncultured Clostridium sp.]